MKDKKTRLELAAIASRVIHAAVLLYLKYYP
jgi:hypothetical protein